MDSAEPSESTLLLAEAAAEDGGLEQGSRRRRRVVSGPRPWKEKAKGGGSTNNIYSAPEYK